MPLPTKLPLCLIIAMTALLALPTGCSAPLARSTDGTTYEMRTPLLYVQTWSGMVEGAGSKPFDIILFDSGTLARSDNKQPPGVELSSVDQADLPRVKAAIANLNILQLPPQIHLPPDSRYVEIGIRTSHGFQRYAWTETPDYLPPANASEFRDAWTQAKSIANSFQARTWKPAEPSLSIDDITRRIH